MSPLPAVSAVGAIQVIGAQRRAADLPTGAAGTEAAAAATETRLSGTGLLLQALASLPVGAPVNGSVIGAAALPLAATGTPTGPDTAPALPPLLPAAPLPASADTAALARGLQQALSGSGLFYEAHLLEWVTGTRDAAAIRSEPQAQLPALPALPPAAGDTQVGASAPAGAGAQPTGAAAAHAAPAQSPLLAGLPASAAGLFQRPNPAEAGGASAGHAPGVDARIVSPLAAPLVHQQLQALDTQVVHWNVQAWPGQLVQLSAHPMLAPTETLQRHADGADDADASDADGQAPAPPGGAAAVTWKSTLRLQLPHLGDVQAEIQLSATGCRVQLVACPGSAGPLRQHLPALGQALDHAGLHPESLRVQIATQGHVVDTTE